MAFDWSVLQRQMSANLTRMLEAIKTDTLAKYQLREDGKKKFSSELE